VPHPGDQITYTLTAVNAGPNAAGNVVATDVLPAGVTYVSDDGGGAYATSTGRWTIGTLANGSSTVLHIVVSINSGTGGTVITNTASIVSNNPDSSTGNNSALQSVTSTDTTPGGCGSCGGGQTTPTPPSSGGCGDRGCSGGGNGPIVGSFGQVFATSASSSGQVLGVATSSTACDTYLTAFIRSNYKNDQQQVRRLQSVLRDFEGAKNIKLNGIYDVATLAAVHAFQIKYKSEILTPWGQTKSTGFVYLTTRKKINEIYCMNTRQFSLSPAQQAEVDAYRSKMSPATKPIAVRPVTPTTNAVKPALTPSVVVSQQQTGSSSLTTPGVVVSQQQTGSSSSETTIGAYSSASQSAAAPVSGSNIFKSISRFFRSLIRRE
jgi:uncharacterized repeat protein (TIGR01451 family)